MYEIFHCIHQEEIYRKDAYAFGYANNLFWKIRKLKAQSKILETLVSESFKLAYLSLQTWRNFNKIVIN